MSTVFGEATESASPANASCSSENSSDKDAADFECNICFDLARDPLVTLCGHLFCWPCLYRWLHHHSRSQRCPVCKALVEEEKLVPLYGKGKAVTDPKMKSYLGMEIPRRPSGQRPQTIDEEEEELEEPDYVAPPDLPMLLARLEQMRLSHESMEQRFEEYRESTEQRLERLEQRMEESRESIEQRLEQLQQRMDERFQSINS